MSRETGLEQGDLELRRDLLEGPRAYGAVSLWIHSPLTLLASLPLGGLYMYYLSPKPELKCTTPRHLYTI